MWEQCEEHGISNGGFRDDLIKRIRTFERERDKKAEKERKKAVAKARKKAEKAVEKGVVMFENEDWVGAAAAFENAGKVLADFSESPAYKTAMRCLKALRNKMVSLEAEAAFSLENFLIEQRALLGKRGRSDEEVRATQRLLDAVSRDLGPEPEGVGMTGRCRICTLANPCPTHTTTEQRAHKLLTMQILVAPESDKAEARKRVANYMGEEQSRSNKFVADAQHDADTKRAAADAAALATSEAQRVAAIRSKFEADQAWKKRMHDKREKRMREVWRVEALAGEKRAEELQRAQDARVTRVKHLTQAKKVKHESKQKDDLISVIANSMLGSRLTRERSLKKYDRMIRKDMERKEKEEADRKKQVEAEMALSIQSAGAEMQKAEEEEALRAKGCSDAGHRAGGGEGDINRAIALQPGKIDSATLRDRMAADAAIWSLVNDALAAPLPGIEYKTLSDEHVGAMQDASDRQKSMLGASKCRELSETANYREGRGGAGKLARE